MTKVHKSASELMPQNEASLRVLKERAALLAQDKLDTQADNDNPYVQFRIGHNERYGIPYEYVQEILYYSHMAKPPGTPDFVAGVINWRGALITVVDLIPFFHLDHAEHKNEFIIVINANDMVLGILVNHIDGSEHYDSRQLSIPLSSINVARSEYILGLHQSVVAILNLDTLVTGLSQDIKKEVYKKGDVHGHNY